MIILVEWWHANEKKPSWGINDKNLGKKQLSQLDMDPTLRYTHTTVINSTYLPTLPCPTRFCLHLRSS